MVYLMNKDGFSDFLSIAQFAFFNSIGVSLGVDDSCIPIFVNCFKVSLFKFI